MMCWFVLIYIVLLNELFFLKTCFTVIVLANEGKPFYSLVPLYIKLPVVTPKGLGTTKLLSEPLVE